MKKSLLAIFVLAAFGFVTAEAQTQSFTAPAGAKRSERTPRRPAPVYTRGPIGAFPRAARGNPIQMLNPRAPQKYFGPPQDTFTYDQDNPSRVTGLIFFGFRW